MPTYLNANKFPFSKCSTAFGGASDATNISAMQIPCPLIYEHIKSCPVCQQAVKNMCASTIYSTTSNSQVQTIDKNTLILYGIFFLFLVILITVMFKR